jgi:hypothetical protein
MAAKRPPNTTETTPSGIEIAFWDKTGLDGKPQQRRYKINGEKFVSVSTVCNVYEKPALMHWNERITATGVTVLARAGNEIPHEPAALIAVLREHGLDWQSVRDAAAERGDQAHDMLVRLIRDGKVPRLSAYPEEIRPWISAGMRWAMHAEPKVLDAERMVASVEHGFAGRFDLYCGLRDGRTARVDFKTVTEWHVVKDSKGQPTGKLLPPYDENLSQVAGYEIGAVESGYPASDVQLVVRLGPDGDYDVCESWARPEHFLGDLAAYRNRADLRAAKKAAAPQEVAA